MTKPDPARLTDAEIYAMVDSLGDVGAALTRANPDRMCKIYDSLRLEMVYDHDERAVDVAVKPLGGLVRVSEGRLAHKPPDGKSLTGAGTCVLRRVFRIETLR